MAWRYGLYPQVGASWCKACKACKACVGRKVGAVMAMGDRLVTVQWTEEMDDEYTLVMSRGRDRFRIRGRERAVWASRLQANWLAEKRGAEAVCVEGPKGELVRLVVDGDDEPATDDQGIRDGYRPPSIEGGLQFTLYVGSRVISQDCQTEEELRMVVDQFLIPVFMEHMRASHINGAISVEVKKTYRRSQ